MKKNKVILIHSNALALNVRGFKEIEANNEEYQFTFLGWNRNKEPLENFKKPENSTISLLNIKAPYGKLYLIVMILWWIYVFLWLLIRKWDMVHVINLDSAFPAILAAKLKGKKSIYEILDTYEDSLVLPYSIRNFLVKFDKLLISCFDAVILVDEEQIDELDGIPNNNLQIIYDSPPDIPQNMEISKNDKEFSIFYAGALHKDRKLNLNKILRVLRELDDVKIIMAGYGDKDCIAEIKKFENEMPDKITFIGKISYDEVIRYSLEADMLFQLRDSSVKINKYICGSTMFNSMAVGTPIIVNKGTSTANKVENSNSGLLVDVNNQDEIKMAILKLKNDEELRIKLGINARKAYENKYSWNIMEKRLKTLYKDLLRNN